MQYQFINLYHKVLSSFYRHVEEHTCWYEPVCNKVQSARLCWVHEWSWGSDWRPQINIYSFSCVFFLVQLPLTLSTWLVIEAIFDSVETLGLSHWKQHKFISIGDVKAEQLHIYNWAISVVIFSWQLKVVFWKISMFH